MNEKLKMPLSGAQVCTFATYQNCSQTLIVPCYRVIQRNDKGTQIEYNGGAVWFNNDLLVGLRIPYATGDFAVRANNKITRIVGLRGAMLYTDSESIDLSPLLDSII